MGCKASKSTVALPTPISNRREVNDFDNLNQECMPLPKIQIPYPGNFDGCPLEGLESPIKRNVRSPSPRMNRPDTPFTPVNSIRDESVNDEILSPMKSRNNSRHVSELHSPIELSPNRKPASKTSSENQSRRNSLSQVMEAGAPKSETLSATSQRRHSLNGSMKSGMQSTKPESPAFGHDENKSLQPSPMGSQKSANPSVKEEAASIGVASKGAASNTLSRKEAADIQSNNAESAGEEPQDKE